MKKYKKPYVVMFGPDLNAKSGISNVINNWIENKIDNYIQLHYIATLKHCIPKSRYILKSLEAFKAYIVFFGKSFKKIDIVHIHFSDGMSVYRKIPIFLYSKLRKYKTIIHMHLGNLENFYYQGKDFNKRIIRFFFDNADAIFVISRLWEKEIKKITKNKNVYVIYNGADINKFMKENIERGKKINIAFMGRLDQNKGIYDLKFKTINQ